MPKYNYHCETCDKDFIVDRAFGEPWPTECPEGHQKIRKIWGVVDVVFKGSGFYSTDGPKKRD